jgi:hypothetical protein
MLDIDGLHDLIDNTAFRVLAQDPSWPPDLGRRYAE